MVLTGHLCTATGGVCLISAETTNDIAEFLSSRRARVTPEQVGLPTYGARREQLTDAVPLEVELDPDARVPVLVQRLDRRRNESHTDETATVSDG